MTSAALTLQDLWLLTRYVSWQLPPAADLVAETSHLRFTSYLLFCTLVVFTVTTCLVTSWALRRSASTYWQAPKMVCTHCRHTIRPASMEYMQLNCIYLRHVIGRTRNRIKPVYVPRPVKNNKPKCVHNPRIVRFKPILALTIESLSRSHVVSCCIILAVIATVTCLAAAHTHNIGLTSLCGQPLHLP